MRKRKRYFAAALLFLTCAVVFTIQASAVTTYVSYDVYRDAGATSLTNNQAASAATSATGYFTTKFRDIVFTRNASGSTSEINPKANCNAGRKVICAYNASPSISCGANASCATVHHKSGSFMLNKRITTVTSRYVIRVVEYPICCVDPNNSNAHRKTNGLAKANGKDVIAFYDSYVVGALVHEVSHLFGGKDSYGSSYSCTPGSQCVMNDISYYNKWCTKCAAKIISYIS